MKQFSLEIMFLALVVIFGLIFVDSFSKIKTLDKTKLSDTILDVRSINRTK